MEFGQTQILAAVFATGLSAGPALLLARLLLEKSKNPLYPFLFLWGVFVAPYLALGFRTAAGHVSSVEYYEDPLRIPDIIFGYLPVAEEVAKFIPILLVRFFFYGRFNVLKAGVFSAAGFATMENIAFLFRTVSDVLTGMVEPTYLLTAVAARTFVALPAHIIYTCVACTGLRFDFMWPAGLFAAATLHAFHNAAAFGAIDAGIPLYFVILGAVGLAAIWVPLVILRGTSTAYIDAGPMDRFLGNQQIPVRP